MHPNNTETLLPKHINSDELYEKTGVLMYHYSYVFPEQVRKKIFYYKAKVSMSKCIDNYFERIYLPWATGTDAEKGFVENIYNGVHEFKPEYRIHSRTKKFTNTHPESIQNNVENLKIKYNEELKKYEY